MPKHEVHLYVDRQNFGRTFPKLHKAMDEPVKVFGRSHRKLFHTWEWALYFAHELYPGDLDAEMAALLHLEYDWRCSKDPDYKKMLEKLARKNVKQREKNKKLAAQWKKIFEENKKQQRKTQKKLEKQIDSYFDKMLKSWKKLQRANKKQKKRRWGIKF